ncbi:MAG: hypothetical protein ACTSRK_11550 [Promethearchaeota archaeon]
METDKETFWRRYEPALPISLHFLISGVMWVFVGQMLISYGIQWFQEKITQYLWLFIVISIFSGLSIYIFGFSKVVHKNIERLQQKQDKLCIFAFMEWKSYLIMVFMMGMGITLRTILGPNEYLGILYIGIGGGMLLSGLIYIKPVYQLIQDRKQKKKLP